jgi:hypothetical protein
MLKSAIVAMLKSRLGNRTESDIDTRIDSELDAAQEDLEHNGVFVPWFLLSETATYTTTIGEQRVPLPADFLQEYDEGALFYDGTPLKAKYDYDALVQVYKTAQAGPPEAYALVNGYFIVFPVPDNAYELSMKYYYSDTVPSSVASGSANQWMKHAAGWLLARAGKMLARYIKDAEVAAMFAEDEKTEATKQYSIHVDRAERNVNRQMGDS